jgi:hypothetical protein
MAKFKITATYEYSGIVEGATEREAEKAFLSDLNDHYVGTDSFEAVAVCPECEEELSEYFFCCGEEEEEEEDN